MKVKTKLILIIVTILELSCKTASYKYPNLCNVSDKKGTPKDSLIKYLPDTIKMDTGMLVTSIDKFAKDNFTEILHSANEPILYNYYLGKDLYRFTWLRSFGKPIIVCIYKKKRGVWLTFKIMNHNRGPALAKTKVKFIPPSGAKKMEVSEEFNKRLAKSDSMISERAKPPKVISSTTKKLSLNEWNEFLKFLDRSDFWKLSPGEGEKTRIDGDDWLLEAHLKNKYWFVSRHDNNCKNCEYLLKLSRDTPWRVPTPRATRMP